MVPGSSCHIYGTWRGTEVRDALKSLLGVEMQATRESGYGGGGFSAVLKLYYKSYWAL